MQLLQAQPIIEKYQPAEPARHIVKTLAIIMVGSHPASELYVSIKRDQAQYYGIGTDIFRLPDSAGTVELTRLIQRLNDDPTYNAMIVQLPLPEAYDTNKILDLITPEKDVDNLTNSNRFTSPMVQAVQALRDFYGLEFRHTRVCVIGQGRLVGKPLREWLESEGMKPTIVDSDTPHKDTLIREADIILGGAGQKYVVNAANTRDGQIIFDCSGKDVDFEAVKNKAAAITPPKGGIGPLTVHFLLTNVLKTG